jgi:hypothetical protein
MIKNRFNSLIRPFKKNNIKERLAILQTIEKIRSTHSSPIIESPGREDYN